MLGAANHSEGQAQQNIIHLQRTVDSEIRFAQSNRLLANISTLFPTGVSERSVLNLNSLVRHDMDMILLERSRYSQRKFQPDGSNFYMSMNFTR
jgi:hypothetical protein